MKVAKEIVEAAVNQVTTWQELHSILFPKIAYKSKQLLKNLCDAYGICYIHFHKERNSYLHLGIKYCGNCNEIKTTDEFGSRASGKLMSMCLSCKREHDRIQYHENPKRKDQIKNSSKKVIEKNKEYVFNYLLTHPCVDCQETNPIYLEFDHITDDKVADVTKLLNWGYGLTTIIQEINKCVVRCGHCHKKKTAKTRDSFTYQKCKAMGLVD